MNLITCNHLSLGYEGKAVISDLSFAVAEGDYLCIVGENGTGKSTLMHGLIGLKTPLAGEIVYAPSLRPSEIGYLPQQTVVQRDFPATVYEIVLSGCKNNRRTWHPFYSKAEHARAAAEMEKLGITALRNKCYRSLSGGQQQRTLLSRALCATQKVLLLDEPMAGLDPIVTAELYDCIGALSREGITVIMVSHDMHSVTHNATHVLHIGRAGETFFGTADAYRESELGARFLQLCKCPDHDHHDHEEAQT